MRKLLMLLVVAGMLIGAGIVVAETKLSKWEGFRGLKWATSIKDVNDMVVLGPVDNKEWYSRITDKLSIGRAKLKSITYGSYKDQFCTVYITSEGYSNFTYFKAAVFAYYGEGRQGNEYIKEWTWHYGLTDGKVFMVLKYNEFSEKTHLCIWYGPVIQENARDDADAADDAESDF